MSKERTVKVFYQLPNGKFGLVEMTREHKKRIDRLIAFLRILGIAASIDKERLRKTWKQYNRDNVRRWQSPNNVQT